MILAGASADNPTAYGPSSNSEGSMPTERLSMRKIRDVPRLKFESGLSERVIGRAMSLSNGSVNSYLQRARMAGLGWPLPDGLDDAALERLLFPPAAAPDAAGARARPEWVALDKEMRRKGVTLALLWEEYRAAHPDGFGYSWFCEQYGAFKSRLRPSMRQSHAAGEKVFVDFAGDTIDVIDPSTGEVRPMKLFVASSYIFAQARPSEQIADWIGAHVDLLAFLGGAPKFVVCDNLKAAVTNPDRYEPGLNRSYLEFADHYGVAILPARPYKPRDKAKVEQSVLIAERWILARLRNRRFFSAADLNVAIADDASRVELFTAIDKPALKALPDEPYAFAVWKRCRVAPDYHVEVDGHWYSTPFRLTANSSTSASPTRRSRFSTRDNASPAIRGRRTAAAIRRSPSTCRALTGATPRGRRPASSPTPRRSGPRPPPYARRS